MTSYFLNYLSQYFIINKCTLQIKNILELLCYKVVSIIT